MDAGPSLDRKNHTDSSVVVAAGVVIVMELALVKMIMIFAQYT